jgi:peptide methionine sulfoxide reductase MsrA
MAAQGQEKAGLEKATLAGGCFWCLEARHRDEIPKSRK